ncbi:putative Na+/H+ antiporter [Pelomonas sp. SE-A7]|uniref:putative Na+/H+ antiporter n=1 Tax=Pelomonas sp. SE-A7 TaxID=3054953 RepID=UPI00259CF841|nr:putative Na+/H+ antiporter [Pelomonas sp. SE-A7]MDM4766319.1 putative Na+/H+ antiporter [Pelomonas sp. SE-A7]
MTNADPTTVQLLAAALFALALVHTFSTKFFEHLAHTRPRHAGLLHLLGEVEVVFGLWAMVLVLGLFALEGSKAATGYVDTRNYTEPLFVFAIMVVAASRPVLEAASSLVRLISRVLPLAPGVSLYLVLLGLVPLLGSFITEPAAMTLAALMLRDRLFADPTSSRLRYATVGVLFVNISIGGTLTPFAAPPVLMVAGVWQWDMGFMLGHFGWKAALAVAVNAAAAALLFRRELAGLAAEKPSEATPVPLAVTLVHLLFLAGIVVFAHHPALFMGLLLFFLGFTTAYQRHQSPLILREALLVAFFLAGLVVLGGLQQWWLQPLLMKMDSNAVFYGATALTALTDNAALTYLGSLVPGLSDDFKIALVAGAVTGGGLTVVANAPNPAGVAILRGSFEDQTISPLQLLLAALPPTLVAVAAFRLL